MREPRPWGPREEEMHRNWQRARDAEGGARMEGTGVPRRATPDAGSWCPCHGYGDAGKPDARGHGGVGGWDPAAACLGRPGCPPPSGG